MLCFILPAAISVQFLGHQALRFTRRAREATDRLFKHLRSLTDGLKELKNHNQRRQAFFSQVFQPTADDLQKQNVKADLIIHIANNWGQFVYFIIIGLLLFAVP